jgi:hypothetical protein
MDLVFMAAQFLTTIICILLLILGQLFKNEEKPFYFCKCFVIEAMPIPFYTE